jgi:hypothetical protein
VLADPAVVAQPDPKVAEEDAEDVVGRTGPEDLPVPSVVPRGGGTGRYSADEDAAGQRGRLFCHGAPGPADGGMVETVHGRRASGVGLAGAARW